MGKENMIEDQDMKKVTVTMEDFWDEITEDCEVPENLEGNVLMDHIKGRFVEIFGFEYKDEYALIATDHSTGNQYWTKEYEEFHKKYA